jgi:predicted ATPase
MDQFNEGVIELTENLITAIEVSNYRSLGADLRVNLGRLTALVGANGVGKSNVADLIRFLAEALSVGLEAAIASRHGIDVVRRWSSGRPFNLSVRAELTEESFSGSSGSYGFTLAGDSAEAYRLKEEQALVYDKATGASHRFQLHEGKWAEGPADPRPQVTGQSLTKTLVAGDERFAPLASALRNVCVYAVFLDTLREPQKPDTVRPMRQHGENWTTVLQGMTANGAAGELKAALAKLTVVAPETWHPWRRDGCEIWPSCFHRP